MLLCLLMLIYVMIVRKKFLEIQQSTCDGIGPLFLINLFFIFAVF